MSFIFLLQSFLTILLLWLSEPEVLPGWIFVVCIFLWCFTVGSVVDYSGSIHETQNKREQRQEKSYKSAKIIAIIYTVILSFIYLSYFIGDY